MALKIKLPKIKFNLFKDKSTEIAALAEKAVQAAEDQLAGSEGSEKLTAVADALNLAVDIPYLPETLETIIFRGLAQLAHGFWKNRKKAAE